MSDDAWRKENVNDEEEDFGPPLFGDAPTSEVRPGDLSFDDDTGSLPHWTEPATGEIPRVLADAAPPDPTDDLDVWSSFSSQSPVWSDDERAADPGQDPSGAVAAGRDQTGGVSRDQTGGRARDQTGGLSRDQTGGLSRDQTGGLSRPGDPGRDPSAPVRREPGRIMIGTDPTDRPARPMPPRRGRVDAPTRARAGRDGRPSAQRVGTGAPPSARDLPTAVAVGVGLAAVFIASILWRPAAALVVVAVVLGLAAVEYFDKVTEKGYRPATIVGIAACVAMPLAVYWVGMQAMPLVLVLVLAATSVTFIGAAGVEAAPMPNTAITTLGVVWIALLGGYAALILKLSTFGFAVADNHVSFSIGTDTLFLIALGVVANDVGALFVGSGIGRTPLRAWISPNKSVEGLVGGTLATLVVLGAIGASGKSHTWNSLGDCLLLAIVICIFAPLGDLTESMFKRNLDVKDFGTIVKGHGGVLDRFDGFLFTLPAAYYLLDILKPWVTK